MSNDNKINPPLTELDINTTNGGFYNGFATSVAVPAKIIISALVVWAIFWPVQSGAVLNGYNSLILDNFAAWYIWVVAFFVIVCFVLALWPAAGKLNLGVDGEGPEFSNFSWFSMMFGAGIGVGMLTWAVAEPVAHFQSNPETIQGLTNGGTADNIRMAYKWSFLHWGLGAWACYAICGLSLAFFSYRRGLPGSYHRHRCRCCDHPWCCSNARLWCGSVRCWSYTDRHWRTCGRGRGSQHSWYRRCLVGDHGGINCVRTFRRWQRHQMAVRCSSVFGTI